MSAITIIRHLVVAEFGNPYLSRVDLLAGECVVVGTHIGCCVDILRLYWLSISKATQVVLWVEVVVVELVTKIVKVAKMQVGGRYFSLRFQKEISASPNRSACDFEGTSA